MREPHPATVSRRTVLKSATALMASSVASCGGGADAVSAAPPLASKAADVPAPAPAPMQAVAPPPPAPPPPPPPPVGAWQPLAVAPHMRKVITTPGDGTVGAFRPAKSLALEAQAAVSVEGIPARAFSLVVPGERGVFYVVGGLHSNYQGNEIDRFTLPVGDADRVITTHISHQPNMPPEGPYSGYASGNGGYIHRQFAGGLTDASDWQPYPGHQWTKNGWHPDWGFFSLTAHALTAADGSVRTAGGLALSSAADPGDVWPPGAPVAKTDYGVVGFDWARRKYTTHLSTVGKPFPQNLLGQSGVSDFNNWEQAILFLQTNGGTTYIQQHRLGGGYGLTSLASTGVIGGYDGSGGNGLLVRTLEQRKYLILRQDGNGTFRQRTKLLLYAEDFGAGDARFVTLAIPPVHTGDIKDNVDGLSFTVDKNSRRVFWLVFPDVGVPVRFYVSTFEDLMQWTQVTFTPDIVIPDLPYRDAWLAANRQPLLFRDGYLYLNEGDGPGNPSPGFTDGTMHWRRVKVDAGEDLPPMDFKRHDYREQNFVFSTAAHLQLWGNKHANWACRATTGEHIVCGGDLGGAFNASMAKLVFNDSSRGYTFTELLNETQPAPRHPATREPQKRPASPDDGAWFYSGPGNAEPALRDKFIYARGGDGLGFVSNVHTRAAYAPHATDPAAWNSGANDAGADAAMARDGWTMDRLVVYDPATNGFSETGVAGWAFDAGGMPLNHPAALAGNSSRCAAFDESRNHLFRFTDYSGSLFLARYDLARRAVKVWNVSSWFDTAGLMGDAGRRWHCDNQNPTTQPIVNGFGWHDAPAGRWRTSAANHWEHKAVWIDEADGRLYCVSPQTGYLWCYETRGTETDFGAGGNGRTIPFGPVGQRIPLVGTYPATNCRDRYPPVRWDVPGSGTNADLAMNSCLVPFKGGLLWWSSAHHDSGAFGHPRYAFWRRLGFAGAWTVVTMPAELAANSYSVVSRSIDNTEVVLLAGGGNCIDTQGPWPFFWQMT